MPAQKTAKKTTFAIETQSDSNDEDIDDDLSCDFSISEETAGFVIAANK